MNKIFVLTICSFLAIATFSGCKKDNTSTVSQTGPKVLGLYEFKSDNYKRVFIGISKIGDKTVNYLSVFDTGSAGLTIDAAGILPESMITADGLKFTGDSVVVNGITVTSKTAIMSYGDATGLFKEYGNLAYTSVTIGDANGSINIKRVPIFLYYKIKNITTNTTLPPHSADIFGVATGYSYAGSSIQSPLNYLKLDAGLKKGFKLALLNRNNFSTTSATFTAGLLSLGLTQEDISSSGFIMHPLSFNSQTGYAPVIPATITYNGVSTAAQVLFDTGNPQMTIIENKLETNSLGNLPANSVVNVTTNKGFSYTYTTSGTSNFTTIQNPDNSKDYRSIFSIDFFIDNEYLTNYADNIIGLKNN